MGWFSDFIGNPLGTVTNTLVDVSHAITAPVVDPFDRGDIKAGDVAKAAAVAAGAYYGAPYLGSLGEASGLAEVTSAGTSAGLFPDLAAGQISTTGYTAAGEIAGFADAEAARAAYDTNAGIADYFKSTGANAPGGPSFNDYLRTGTSVVNLAGAGVKLAGVNQLNERLKMTNSTPNAQNLIGQTLDIAPTPAGLTGSPVVATTPTGPVMAPTKQNGMMDQKTMMIVLGAAAAMYFLWQYKKGA